MGDRFVSHPLVSSRETSTREVEPDGVDFEQTDSGRINVNNQDGAVYPYTAESAVPDLFTLERDTDRGAISYLQRRFLNGVALAIGDGLALVTAVVLAAGVSMAWSGAGGSIGWMAYLLPLWYLGGLWTGLLPSWGVGPVALTRRQILLLLGVFPSAGLLAQLDSSIAALTGLQVAGGLLLGMIAIPLVRAGVKRILRRFDLWGVPVVIYGSGSSSKRIIHSLQKHGELGYRPVGVFQENPTANRSSVDGVPVLGGAELVSEPTAVAVVAVGDHSRQRMSELLEGPLSHYRKVLVVSDLFEIPPIQVKHQDLNGLQGLEIDSRLRHPLARIAKRAMDLALVLAAAPLWVPLCGILTLLVWLEDRHFPFFRQKRVGRNGREFHTCKFRTMVPNAEEVLLKELAEDDELREEWENSYKLEDDPRVTRVGDFLRRSSLDELPQLYNVLQGDMSLVGPRPLPRYHHEELSSRTQELRERVYPGITGLWQVSGRSDVGTQGMERWDPYYVQNWSVWFDLVILVRTIPVVVKGSGAY